MSDKISAPEHYTFSKYEPNDVIYEWQLDFYLGNVVKYIAMAGRKAGSTKIEDLQKARQYIDFELEKLQESADQMPQSVTERRGVFIAGDPSAAITPCDLRDNYLYDDGKINMIGSLRVKPIENTYNEHQVFIDGTEIKNVRSLVFGVDVDSIPEATIEISGKLDYNGLARIGLTLEPEAVRECIMGLQFALQMDYDLRNGFVASIKSALDEAKNYESNEKLSERILDRILGVDTDVIGI